jgi:hypothetical protein
MTVSNELTNTGFSIRLRLVRIQIDTDIRQLRDCSSQHHVPSLGNTYRLILLPQSSDPLKLGP